MIAAIANTSQNAVQVFALIAVILFAFSTIANVLVKAWGIAILTGGLAFLALAVIFLA